MRVRHDFLPPANTKLNRCKPPRACWLLTKEWPLTSLSCTGRAENLHSKYWWIIYYYKIYEFTVYNRTIFCIFSFYRIGWNGGKARVSLSDLRLPLMWRDTDHFKNKGDYRRFAVFCLAKIGTQLYDTSLMFPVDRSMTDVTFNDVLLL